MKKSILLLLLVLLSTNILLIDETPISNGILVQVSEKEKVEQIQTNGAWFTEEDML